jgi:hypothetical protein
MDTKIETWSSHAGRSRAVQLHGQTHFHLHCVRCQRDFVRQSEVGEWKAVHLGIFEFNLLDEATSQQWVSEQCPGRPLAADANDLRRTRVASLQHRAT